MTQEINPYDVVIADLEAKRDQLISMIEVLKGHRLLVLAPIPLSQSSSTRAIGDQEIPHDAFFQMTIPEAARKYLTIVKRTKAMSEIIDAVLKGGLKSSAKDVKNSLRSIISRDGTFVRVNGEWGLAEWYPALRRDGKKIKPNSGSDGGETIAERIMATMKELSDSVVTADQLAENVGAHVGTVRASLSNLVKEGKIQRVAIGQYVRIGGDSESESDE